MARSLMAAYCGAGCLLDRRTSDYHGGVLRSDQLGSKGDWVVDEEAASRHLIRQHLKQSPEERLRNLEAFYEVFLFGQRNLGRAVFRPE